MLLTLLMMMIATDDVPAARMIQPGPLPLSQVRANIAARFAALDVNADGAIDRGEAETAAANARASIAARSGGRIVSDIPGDGPDAAWFDASDADHDGKITLAEFSAQPLANFRRLDSDQDGILSVAERQRGLRRED